MSRFPIVLSLSCLAVCSTLRRQTADDCVVRGDASLENGNEDAAIAAYTQALALDPKNVRAYVQRGTAWCKKCQFDVAIAQYNQALAIDP